MARKPLNGMILWWEVYLWLLIGTGQRAVCRTYIHIPTLMKWNCWLIANLWGYVRMTGRISPGAISFIGKTYHTVKEEIS